MIVHINKDDLDFLIGNLSATLEGVDDRESKWAKQCERIIEKAYKKIEEAENRDQRKRMRKINSCH